MCLTVCMHVLYLYGFLFIHQIWRHFFLEGLSYIMKTVLKTDLDKLFCSLTIHTNQLQHVIIKDY